MMKWIIGAAIGAFFMSSAVAQTNPWVGVPSSGPQVQVTVGGAAVSTNNALPTGIAAGSPVAATTTSITTGGTSQTLFGAGTVLHGCLIHNPSTATESLFISFTGAASPTAGNSLEIQKGETFSCPFIPVSNMTIVGATTGHAFEAMRF